MVKAIRKTTAAKSEDSEERWALPARQARSRATRSRILSAAEKVFAEKGYDGARLGDIAEAAKCSVGAVYFRFKDKDALFFAIAENFNDEVKAGIAELALRGAGEDAPTIVRTFVHNTAAMFRAHKGLLRALVERGFEHPMPAKTVFGARLDMEAALSTALAGKLAHRLSDLSLRVMTQMVYGFLLNGVLNPRAPARIDDDATVEEVANVLLAYLESQERHP